MFDDMFKDMEARSAQIEARLAATTVEESVGDGTVRIKANGMGEFLEISLNSSKLAPEYQEELEDLILIAMNRVQEKVHELADQATSELYKDVLPPDLDSLLG